MIIKIISETKRSNVLRMENDPDHVEQLVRENLASSSPTIETKFVRSHPSPRRNSQHHGRRRRPNFGNALDQPCPKSSFRPRRWINRKGIDFLPAWWRDDHRSAILLSENRPRWWPCTDWWTRHIPEERGCRRERERRETYFSVDKLVHQRCFANARIAEDDHFQ